MNEKPERYEEALEIVKDSRQVSVQFLMRKLRIGYTWAARIVDRMEKEEHIGPYRGEKPREVFIK